MKANNRTLKVRSIKRLTMLAFLIAILSTSAMAQHKVITSVDILKMKTSHAVEKCKTDQIHNRLMLTDTTYKNNFKAAQKAARAYMPGGTKTAKSTTLTIPVVVHVLHLGEAVGTGTNISDAQIQSAIDNMNDCYSGVAPYVTDLGIQFELAQRDPDCNATTGILRVNASGTSDYSTNGITDANEATIKALSKWPNAEYYNIWIVSEIDGNDGGSGTQGYAYFPGASSEVDGSVILYNSFGYDPTETLGYELKSYTNYNATANHEIGHALNLYHTFEGDDANSDGTADQCPTNTDPSTDGDQCADTDPHRRDDGDCGSTGTTCAGAGTDLSDIVTNIMAYSSDQCQVKFSNDQRTRMRAALQGTRSGLLTSPGLQPISGSEPAAALTCTPATTNTSNSFGIGVYGLAIATAEYSSSGAVADGGYRNNWCSNFSLNTSTLYNITVTTGSLNSEDVRVYIDYNNDGDFDDANEEIFTSDGVIQTHSGNFTVPAAPTTGTSLWLRVVSDFAGNTITGPCYGPQYGQVEDFSLTITSSGAAPVADFSADQTTVCSGTAINFTDASTNTPTSWTWDFGDGSGSSTAQNPSYTYSSAGTYTVTLTATNASGSDNEVKTSYITINDVPGNAGAITGSSSECENSSGVGYSIAAVSGATSYAWTVPADATVTSGQGTTSITVDFGTNSGVVEVTPSNACGSGAASNVNVTLNSCITTQLEAGYCGTTATDLSDPLWCDAVSGAHYYRFRFHNPSSGGDEYLITTSRYCYPSNASLAYNTTYEVYVNWRNSAGIWQGEGVACNFTTPGVIPTTTLRASDCGITATDLDDPIWADLISGAIRYRFRFHDAGTGSNFYLTSTSRYCYPSNAPLTYNTTYQVYVAWQDGDLNWQAEGAACDYTTPGQVTTQIRASQCGTALPSMHTKIYADHVPVAIRYRFRFHNSSTGADIYATKTGRVTTAKQAWLDLSTTYDVYVAWQDGTGAWQPEGAMCQLTTPATLSKPVDMLTEYTGEKSLTEDVFEFEANAYPNPVQDVLNVNWTGEGDVVLTLVDLSGKVTYQQIHSHSNVAAVNLQNLAGGLYILRATQGDKSKTIRIMKE